MRHARNGLDEYLSENASFAAFRKHAHAHTHNIYTLAQCVYHIDIRAALNADSLENCGVTKFELVQPARILFPRPSVTRYPNSQKKFPCGIFPRAIQWWRKNYGVS